MRFPSKKQLVRASLILIFAVPTLAHADDKVKKVDENTPDTSKYLSFEDARAAFGPDFSLEKSGDSYVLYGNSSLACLGNDSGAAGSFTITPSPDKANFMIKYDGKNDDCLDHDKAIGKVKSKFKDIVQLSELKDAKFTPTKSFKKVTLVREDPTASKERYPFDELTDDDGKSYVFESSDDKAKRIKKDKDDAARIAEDKQFYLVSQCHTNLAETDVGYGAVDAILKMKDFIIPEDLKDKDGWDQKDKKSWASARKTEFREEELAACKLEFKSATFADIAKSKCDKRFTEIAKEDKTKIQEIADAYLALATRFATLSVADLVNQKMAMVDALAGASQALKKRNTLLGTDDADPKAISDQLAIDLKFVQMSTALGSASSDFKAMRQNLISDMLSHDPSSCVAQTSVTNPATLEVITNVGINPAQSANPDCVTMKWAVGNLGVLTNTAVTQATTLQLQADAAKIKAQDAQDLQMCQLKTDAKASMTALETTRCTSLKSAADQSATTLANGSLTSAGTSFGSTSNGTTTAANTTAIAPVINTAVVTKPAAAATQYKLFR
jgi:hypothetical protein